MATVTGLTAARMLEIEAASVIDGDIVGDDLILTRHDGTPINAGSVRGPQGDPGIPGSDVIVVADTPILNTGLFGQFRAGRVLTEGDFTLMGLSAPLGLWNLSDLTDVSPHTRNLSNKGSVGFAPGINGVASNSAKFNGSNSQALYISDTGSGDAFRLRNGSWGCWMRTAKRGTSAYLITKWGTLAANRSWGLVLNSDGRAYAIFGDGTTDYPVFSQSDVCDDRWHFLVGTYDGTRLCIYVDGALETFLNQTQMMNISGTAPLNIGGAGGDASTAANAPHFGQVDEAFVTADVLTEDQVRMLACAKVTHPAGFLPTRVSLSVRRARRGAALLTTDFPTTPIRLHNFSAGSIGNEGSDSNVLTTNGTVRNVAGADGSLENAFAFQGGGSFSSSDSNLPATTGARSYGAWIKSSVGVQATAFGWGTVSGGLLAEIGFNAAGALYAGGLSGGPIVNDGKWHFVVVAEDNSVTDTVKVRVYLDGRLVLSGTTLTSITLAGANRFRIGGRPDGTLPFYGQIDATFVCGYALTADQISVLYNKSSQVMARSPKNEGDHVEAIMSDHLLVLFDSLDPTAQVSMGVA